MTSIFLIRHGEPDWDGSRRRGLVARDTEFTPLTEAGERQILELAEDPRLAEAELIVSSPYTRSLQSAALLAGRLGLRVRVEYGLHEWHYHRDPGMHIGVVKHAETWDAILAMNGDYPPPADREWESPAEIRARALAALRKYAGRRCILAVVHAGVIYSLVGKPDARFGEVVPFSLQ